MASLFRIVAVVLYIAFAVVLLHASDAASRRLQSQSRELGAFGTASSPDAQAPARRQSMMWGMHPKL